MPRYTVERTFLDGLHIPMTDEGAIGCLAVVDRCHHFLHGGLRTRRSRGAGLCRKNGDSAEVSAQARWSCGGLRSCAVATNRRPL